MSDSNVTHPDYIRIVERVPGGWMFKKGRLFHKRVPIASADLDDFELMYGISKQQAAVELFRVNGGKAGYYLADLRHKRYYYCGTDSEAIKATLLTLGIGRAEPMN